MSAHHADAHLSLLRDCADICRATLFEHCLLEGGAHTAPNHVQAMTDCIEMCKTAVDFIARGSAMHGVVCAACAEICDQCAQSCQVLSDAVMQHCAQTCRECAEACRAMAQREGYHIEDAA